MRKNLDVPLPVEDLRHILTNFVDVVLVLYQLVVHLLDEVSTAIAQLGQILAIIILSVFGNNGNGLFQSFFNRLYRLSPSLNV